MDRDKRNLLVFGYGMVVLLGFFGTRNYLHHGLGAVNIILLILSAAFFFITLFSQPALKQVYKGWMKIAHVIGGIVTTIILSAFFYLVFGTIGLVSRALGKDLLDQRVDRSRGSYWFKRELKSFKKESYTKQF